MKKVHLLIVLLLGTGVFALAAESKKQPEQRPTPESESQLIAQARASYPLKTCIASDEVLGDLSEATACVHREPGKRDRVIFVCCEGCIDDFKKEPAKYLAKLDAAETAAKKKK